MRQEGLTFSVVLDEGGAVVEGFFKAISQPIAAVGVCEKGNAHVNISSFVEGGILQLQKIQLLLVFSQNIFLILNTIHLSRY